MNILGTGLSGLVGSRIVDLLSPEYAFENLSLETGVDITDKQGVDSYLSKTNASWVLHMAAYTNVQEAEDHKDLAQKVNVTATEYIADGCKKRNIKLLYVDTDYAFNGEKKKYTEEDTPSPQGWYATTKTEGAKRVLALGNLGCVMRISNPYRAHPVGKKDWVHKMIDELSAGRQIKAPKDQLFSPTFIDDIAVAIKALISNDARGVYHVVSQPALSPFDAAVAIANAFGFKSDLIIPVPFATMFKDRVPIPQYADLKNDKITSLGVTMHSFYDGIKIVKDQETA